MMLTNRWIAPAGAALLALAVSQPAPADVVVYDDNFDDAATQSLLDGRTPATGGAWTASSDLRIVNTGGDGELYTNDRSGTGGDWATAALASTDAPSYTLSAGVRALDVGWIGVGFFDADGSILNQGQLWLLVRNNGSEIELRDNSNSVVTETSTGYTWGNFSLNAIELSYDGATNTVSVAVNGDALFSDVALSAAQTPSFARVGVQFQASVESPNQTASRSRIDDISVLAVPEPGAAALLLGGGALMLVRRRS